MELRKLTCPSCGGQLNLPEDLSQVTCTYCGNQLVVDVGDGYAALRIAEQVSSSIRESGAATTSAIRDSSEVTKGELRRLQITNEITSLQSQIALIQSEIRSLERGKLNRKIKKQLLGLRSQEKDLTNRIVRLQSILNPATSSASRVNKTVSKKKPSDRNFLRGCFAAFLIYFLALIGLSTLSLVMFGSDTNNSGNAIFSCLNLIFFLIAILGFFYFWKKSNTLKGLITDGSRLIEFVRTNFYKITNR